MFREGKIKERKSLGKGERERIRKNIKVRKKDRQIKRERQNERHRESNIKEGPKMRKIDRKR